MAALETIARLKRIQAAAEADRQLAPEDARFLARALRVALNGIPVTDALGLYGNWKTASRNERRDELLRDAAAALPGLPSHRATELFSRLNRRATSANRGACDVLGDILEANDGKVPGFRTILRALTKTPVGLSADVIHVDAHEHAGETQTKDRPARAI